MTRFVVINENRLCYVRDTIPGIAWTLSMSILRGATYGSENARFYLEHERNVRPATLEDFETYRVCTDGYLNNPESYDMPAA